MFLLSRIVGCGVRAPDGRLVGALADLSTRLGYQHGGALVDRILVRRRRQPSLLVPWSALIALRPHHIEISEAATDFAVTSVGGALAADELLLHRDVLDTQIVDIDGQRLARVADVVLAHRADSRVEIVGVEVGFGAVLRRLGLESLAARASRDAVAWSDLHLTSERGHAVQLGTPRSNVHLLGARGLAELVFHLDTDSATEVLAARGPALTAEVIQASHPAVGERILRALPEDRAADVVAVMPTRSATHWRRRLAVPRLRGRALLRSRVWPRRRHRPPGTER